MYPLVYQNLHGAESIYAAHTVNNNQAGSGPTAIRWYQFNVTGNTIPAAPVQQQSFNNNGDGVWRWMPSINVDGQGNVAIGYSASGPVLNPGIRYAGRLATDPANNLAQGEAVLMAGGGSQTSHERTLGRLQRHVRRSGRQLCVLADQRILLRRQRWLEHAHRVIQVRWLHGFRGAHRTAPRVGVNGFSTTHSVRSSGRSNGIPAD